MPSLRRPRGAVTTRVVLNIDAGTDAGRTKAFCYGARECLDGARILNSSSPYSTGEYILTFHALELALKAFLAKSGMSNDELRGRHFRHSLDNFHEEALRRDLSISTYKATELIESVNEWHEKALVRYEFTKNRELPMCDCLFPLIEEILTASRHQSKD